ncbi:MAG: 50S ribosomal protein L9 [Phycisphaerales bacterium]|nr:50S ribosomal protein L9 [Phycisphaerales bacterium]
MAKKMVELLLLENVEGQGIVGDVVKVRTGFARNYLLPRELATQPSQDLIAQLASKRAAAQAEVARIRAEREKMIESLQSYEIETTRACNEQGLLYGSVTQQDVADMLATKGFGVRARDVRLGQTIKRVGEYDLTIKPDQDLEAHVRLTVKAEGALETDAEEAEASSEEAAEHARPKRERGFRVPEEANVFSD